MAEPPPAAVAARTVLVVDDSDTVRRFVSFALRARGLRVLTARDGLDALERLAAEPADLVITDLSMPGLDGYGLLTALRADPATAETPVVVLSALSGTEHHRRSLELGATSFLPKPLETARLQGEVARHLQ